MLKRWLMVLPIIVLLLAAINTAWRLVQSEIWQSQTEDFLDHWYTEARGDTGFAVDKAEWLVTLAGADNALDSMPASPELLVMRARVLDRGVFNGWSGSTGGEFSELLAWQQAILSRPGWPYSWSEYALARSRRSLIDLAFERALLRAGQLGPWEQQVMENSMILGGYYRGWLPAALQDNLDASHKRLQQHYPHRARQLEKQYLDR